MNTKKKGTLNKKKTHSHFGKSDKSKALSNVYNYYHFHLFASSGVINNNLIFCLKITQIIIHLSKCVLDLKHHVNPN